jgi:hypothetical protein
VGGFELNEFQYSTSLVPQVNGAGAILDQSLMDCPIPAIPQSNVDAYESLFVLETVLREFIIDILEKIGGPKWFNKRLPGDLLKKYRDSVKEARRVRWVNLVPHHPIYYLDFPDLRKIIDRSDNWKDAFESTVGRKDLFLAMLEELDPIRNAVAHNRVSPPSAVALLRVTLDKVRQYLGADRFERLAERSTRASSIQSVLASLVEEGNDCLIRCLAFQNISERSIWSGVKDQWWFDESYLGINLDVVVRYFDLLDDYSSIPRARGTGTTIESWVKTHELQSMFDELKATFQEVVKSLI